jgi:hypothetical protein
VLQCVIIGQGGLKVSIPVYLGRPYFLREGWERKVGYTSHTVTNPIWLPFFSLHGLHCLRFVQIITSVRSSSLTLSFPPCPMRCQLLPCPCPPPPPAPAFRCWTHAGSAGRRAMRQLRWPSREAPLADARAPPAWCRSRASQPHPKEEDKKKIEYEMLNLGWSNVDFCLLKCWNTCR